MARHNALSQGHDDYKTSKEVTHDLLSKYAHTGKMFRWAVLGFGILFVLGIIGFVIRLSDGVSDKSVWGYYAALFAFILTTAQAAPMIAIAPRIAKGHWRRSISRAAEIWSVVGLLSLIMFIPLLWVLPTLEDRRRTLWFFDPGTEPFTKIRLFSKSDLMISRFCIVLIKHKFEFFSLDTYKPYNAWPRVDRKRYSDVHTLNGLGDTQLFNMSSRWEQPEGYQFTLEKSEKFA